MRLINRYTRQRSLSHVTLLRLRAKSPSLWEDSLLTINRLLPKSVNDLSYLH